MDLVLTDLSPARLAAAIEAGHEECLRWWGRSSRAELYESPEFARLITGLPHPLFNSIFRLRFPVASLDERIAAAIAPMRARGLPFFAWVGPSAQPAELPARLEAQGLTRVPGMPGMAVDLNAMQQASSPPDGLVIETLEDASGLATWCDTVIPSFGLPESLIGPSYEYFVELGVALPARYYVGYLDGKPVATSFMLLCAGVAGIFSVGTLPEARRRGIGAAITLAPLRDARELGYRVGILAASSMGEPVYRRLGFQEYCRLDLYLGTA